MNTSMCALVLLLLIFVYTPALGDGQPPQQQQQQRRIDYLAENVTFTSASYIGYIGENFYSLPMSATAPASDADDAFTHGRRSSYVRFVDRLKPAVAFRLVQQATATSSPPQCSEHSLDIQLHAVDSVDEASKRLFELDATDASASASDTPRQQHSCFQVSSSSRDVQCVCYLRVRMASESSAMATGDQLNREALDKYTLRLSVRQSSASAALGVHVLDDNDLEPMFEPSEYVFTLHERQCGEMGALSVIGRVHATDPDVGINGQVRYQLKCASSINDKQPRTKLGSTCDANFGVNWLNGDVYLKRSLGDLFATNNNNNGGGDASWQTREFTFQVIAMDAGLKLAYAASLLASAPAAMRHRYQLGTGNVTKPVGQQFVDIAAANMATRALKRNETIASVLESAAAGASGAGGEAALVTVRLVRHRLASLDELLVIGESKLTKLAELMSTAAATDSSRQQPPLVEQIQLALASGSGAWRRVPYGVFTTRTLVSTTTTTRQSVSGAHFRASCDSPTSVWQLATRPLFTSHPQRHQSGGDEQQHLVYVEMVGDLEQLRAYLNETSSLSTPHRRCSVDYCQPHAVSGACQSVLTFRFDLTDALAAALVHTCRVAPQLASLDQRQRVDKRAPSGTILAQVGYNVTARFNLDGDDDNDEEADLCREVLEWRLLDNLFAVELSLDEASKRTLTLDTKSGAISILAPAPQQQQQQPNQRGSSVQAMWLEARVRASLLVGGKRVEANAWSQLDMRFELVDANSNSDSEERTTMTTHMSNLLLDDDEQAHMTLVVDMDADRVPTSGARLWPFVDTARLLFPAATRNTSNTFAYRMLPTEEVSSDNENHDDADELELRVEAGGRGWLDLPLGWPARLAMKRATPLATRYTLRHQFAVEITSTHPATTTRAHTRLVQVSVDFELRADRVRATDLPRPVYFKRRHELAVNQADPIRLPFRVHFVRQRVNMGEAESLYNTSYELMVPRQLTNASVPFRLESDRLVNVFNVVRANASYEMSVRVTHRYVFNQSIAFHTLHRLRVNTSGNYTSNSSLAKRTSSEQEKDQEVSEEEKEEDWIVYTLDVSAPLYSSELLTRLASCPLVGFFPRQPLLDEQCQLAGLAPPTYRLVVPRVPTTTTTTNNNNNNNKPNSRHTAQGVATNRTQPTARIHHTAPRIKTNAIRKRIKHRRSTLDIDSDSDIDSDDDPFADIFFDTVPTSTSSSSGGVKRQAEHVQLDAMLRSSLHVDAQTGALFYSPPLHPHLHPHVFYSKLARLIRFYHFENGMAGKLVRLDALVSCGQQQLQRNVTIWLNVKFAGGEKKAMLPQQQQPQQQQLTITTDNVLGVMRAGDEFSLTVHVAENALTWVETGAEGFVADVRAHLVASLRLADNPALMDLLLLGGDQLVYQVVSQDDDDDDDDSAYFRMSTNGLLLTQPFVQFDYESDAGGGGVRSFYHARVRFVQNT